MPAFLGTHICCFQSQYQQIYELSKKLFIVAGASAKEDLPEIQGFLARLRAIDAGVRGSDWKLARDQRNEMVHDYHIHAQNCGYARGQP
jgi:hypothetical protein